MGVGAYRFSPIIQGYRKSIIIMVYLADTILGRNYFQPVCLTFVNELHLQYTVMRLIYMYFKVDQLTCHSLDVALLYTSQKKELGNIWILQKKIL